MNKAELIESIAKSADVSKAAATRALDGAIKAISVALKKGDVVTLVGFGSFTLASVRLAPGAIPGGAAIKIKAAKVPKFRAGKALKDAINQQASLDRNKKL